MGPVLLDHAIHIQSVTALKTEDWSGKKGVKIPSMGVNAKMFLKKISYRGRRSFYVASMVTTKTHKSFKYIFGGLLNSVLQKCGVTEKYNLYKQC